MNQQRDQFVSDGSSKEPYYLKRLIAVLEREQSAGITAIPDNDAFWQRQDEWEPELRRPANASASNG